MFTEQDKGADIPAHDKHANRGANESGADGIYIAKEFRCKIERIRTECVHETSVDSTKHDKPKEKQNLVFSKMQEQQLNWERIYKPFKPGFHTVVSIVIQNTSNLSQLQTKRKKRYCQ